MSNKRYPAGILGLVWTCLGLAVLAVGSGPGCGAGNPHPPGSYERGVYFAEHGKEVEAVAALESYVRRNPTDSLASEAQFLKAMTYMKTREFPLAAVEFQILRKDFPTSPRVEDAYFQEGLAYLGQVGKVERDFSGATEARLHFQKFLEVYPGSTHLAEARQTLQHISDLMVQKRLQQIRVYQQLNQHEAVALTLDVVLAQEAGSTLLDQVLWVRAETAAELDRPEEARRFYQRLVDEFPESDLARKASGRLDRGAISMDGPESGS